MNLDLFVAEITITTDGLFYNFLEYLYVFIIGSFVGYIIEVLFRRFVSMKKRINPGFLKGPCLPLYGFGLATLHLVSKYCFEYLCDPSTVPSFYKDLATGLGTLPFWAVSLIVIVIIGVLMTLIEYVAGLIFVKGLHIKLWDYSKLKGNIQGIICPLFSFIWLIAGTFYLFALSPLLSKAIEFFITRIWGMTFLLGAYFSIFILDFVNALILSIKVSGKSRELNIKAIDYEKFKILEKKSLKNSKIAMGIENLKQSAAPISSKIKDFNNEIKRHMYIGDEIPEKGSAQNDETPRSKEKDLNK